MFSGQRSGGGNGSGRSDRRSLDGVGRDDDRQSAGPDGDSEFAEVFAPPSGRSAHALVRGRGAPPKGGQVRAYVPTTPNPTGGLFVIVARKDVIELDMSVDEALKYIISMGVVPPENRSGEVRRT